VRLVFGNRCSNLFHENRPDRNFDEGYVNGRIDITIKSPAFHDV